MDVAPPAPEPSANDGALVRASDPAPDGAAPGAGAEARGRRTQAFRAAIQLCRERVAASRRGRFARGMSFAIVGFAFVVALSIRATDGPAAPVGGLLRKAAIALAWIAGGLLAHAAARDTSAEDRADGVEALVAARGVSASLLRGARSLGATSQMVRSIGAPLVVLSLSTAALAADAPSAARRVIAAALLFAWAVVTAFTLGGIATLCARLFGSRGPSAFLAIVVGERLVAGALGIAAWSIPGALDAVLALALGVAGVGGGN